MVFHILLWNQMICSWETDKKTNQIPNLNKTKSPEVQHGQCHWGGWINVHHLGLTVIGWGRWVIMTERKLSCHWVWTLTHLALFSSRVYLELGLIFVTSFHLSLLGSRMGFCFLVRNHLIQKSHTTRRWVRCRAHDGREKESKQSLFCNLPAAWSLRYSRCAVDCQDNKNGHSSTEEENLSSRVSTRQRTTGD